MNVSPKNLWDSCLQLIKENVTEQQFDTWFRPIVLQSYKPASKTLLVQVPSQFVYEYLEGHYVDLLRKVLTRVFGQGVQLTYRVMVDQENHLSQDLEQDTVEDISSQRPTARANQSPTVLDTVPQDLDSQLDPHKSFSNYVEGDSQVQYTDSVRQNTTNDFINFYQTIDILIVDDIQEWVTATKTQDTFFHIFNHLFRNGKRIILASDRPPVDLKGMNDRLLTRFSCGLIAELEKPNVQLCVDILHSKIKRDGLNIPEDVVRFIAETANGSVRDLQGVINSLLAYSVVYNSNIDMRLAERVIKRAVKVDDEPLTIDDIVDKVCAHFNVTMTAVNSRSRKKDIVMARQVSMYMAQKYTKMPASRIGKLVGNRDHSTVIHSCSKIEDRLKVDKGFHAEIASIENSFKLKA